MTYFLICLFFTTLLRVFTSVVIHLFSISTAEFKSYNLMRFCQHLSPALHSNGTHRPFLSWCPGLQWRQRSAAAQMMQSAGQGSHRLLAEWKNPSGQTSRHWPWKRYLATSNLSGLSKKGKDSGKWVLMHKPGMHVIHMYIGTAYQNTDRLVCL